MSTTATVNLLPIEFPALKYPSRIISGLESIHCKSLSDVSVYTGTGLWDRDPSPRELIESHAEFTVAEAVELVVSNPLAFLHASCEISLIKIAQEIVAENRVHAIEWDVLVASVYVGLHSFPDEEFEATRWRGHFSVSLYGDRAPDRELLRGVFLADTRWRQEVAQLAAALKSSVDTDIIVYY